MTVLLADSFPGVNGTAWDATKWTTSAESGSATATVQHGTGQLQTGVTAFNSSMRATSKLSVAKADMEVLVQITPPTTTDKGAGLVGVRCDGTWVGSSPANGYFVTHDVVGTAVAGDTVPCFTVWVVVAGSFTLLNRTVRTYTAGAPFWTRFRAQGTAIWLKVWDASTTEPAAWTLQLTNGVYSTAGQAVLTAANTTNAAVTYNFSSFQISDMTPTLTAVSGLPPTGSTLTTLSITANGTPNHDESYPVNPTADAQMEMQVASDAGFAGLLTDVVSPSVLSGTPTSVTVTMSLTSQPPPPPPTSQFVTVQGGQLKLAGLRYTFAGFAAYQWSSNCDSTGSTMADWTSLFQRFPKNTRGQGTTLRLHAARTATAADISNMVTAAANNGCYLIIVLLDANGQCGQVDGNINNNPTFMDAGNHNAWKAWVGSLVTQYKTNPAILAWEICNEPDRNAIGQARLVSFYQEMTAYIRSLDPNHLIESGTFGVWNYGGSATDYEQVQTTCDIANDHDYSGTTSPKPNVDQSAGLGTAPFYIGEFNVDQGGGVTTTTNNNGTFWGGNPSLAEQNLSTCFANHPNFCGASAWAWDKVQVGTLAETAIMRYHSQL